MNMRITALAAIMTVGLAASAFAADAPKTQQDLCKGQLQTLRISKIRQGGTMAGFLEAVADHNAWYKAHGVNTDVEVVAREIRRDPETKAYLIADDEVVTMHVNPPSNSAENNRKDEAWTAFVKKYRDNSMVMTTRTLCLPAAK